MFQLRYFYFTFISLTSTLKLVCVKLEKFYISVGIEIGREIKAHLNVDILTPAVFCRDFMLTFLR